MLTGVKIVTGQTEAEWEAEIGYLVDLDARSSTVASNWKAYCNLYAYEVAFEVICYEALDC